MTGSPYKIFAVLLLAVAIILPAMAVEGSEKKEETNLGEVKSKFTEKLDEGEQAANKESTSEAKGKKQTRLEKFEKFEKSYLNPAIGKLNNKYQSAEAKLGAMKESALDKSGKMVEKVKTAGANAVDKAKLPPKADAQDETMLQKAKRKASEMSSTFITAMWEAKDKVDAYIHSFFGGAFDRAVHLIKIPEKEVVLAGLGPGVAKGSNIKLFAMRVDKLRFPSYDITLKARPQVSFKITKFHLDLHGNFSLTLMKTNIAVPLPAMDQTPGAFRINMDNIDIELDGELQKMTEEEDKAFMEKLPLVEGLSPDAPKHETEKVLDAKPVKEVPVESKNEQQQVREKRAQGENTESTTEAETKKKTWDKKLQEKMNPYIETLNNKYQAAEAKTVGTYAEIKEKAAKQKAALLEKKQKLLAGKKKTETNEEQKPEASRTVEATSTTEQQGTSKPKENAEKPAKEAEGGGWWGMGKKYAQMLPGASYFSGANKDQTTEKEAKGGEAGEAKPGVLSYFSWIYPGGKGAKGKEEDNPKGYQPRLKFVPSEKTCKGSVEKFNFDIVHLSDSDENGFGLAALNGLIDAGLPTFVNNAIRSYVCDGIALSLNEFLHNRGPKMTKLLAWAVKTPKDDKPKQESPK